MAKSFQQKLKILYLMRIFMQNTDENHPMTVKDLIAAIAEYGISVERKTIYDDIETLKVFGLDIVNRRERPAGFYLASRDFEIAELKLLVDAVQSSKFITCRKSKQLIEKLENLMSKYEANKLRQQVLVEPRIKAGNERIYYNIDDVYRAISKNYQVTFQYYEWNVSKEKQLRKNGERYQVSPWGLIWKDDNYYMIGLDEKTGIMKHYRLDKMLNISIENKPRNGKEIFSREDIAQIASSTFGMFGGKEQFVKLAFPNHLAGVIIDRFGQNVMMRPSEKETHFLVNVSVVVSNQFYGWLAGLGPGVSVKSPDSVRTGYREFLQMALEGQLDDGKV